jgi:polyisoprenyl-phosphate glycosyltransferase
MNLVSIVIPVYHNAPSLINLYHRLASLAKVEIAYDFEYIFVDDGSGDNSYQVLQRLVEMDCRVKVVKLSRNFGSTIAVTAGMNYASGDCVGFIAADLQDPPEKFTEMLRQWEDGSKIVLAIRNHRKGDPWATRMFSNLFNWLFKKLIFDGFSPQGVGFFLLDRQVVKVLIECGEKNAFIPGLLLWTGFTPAMVDYERCEREHGKSRWTFRKKVKYFIDAFAAFSYLPLRLCSVLGISFATLGGLYTLLIIISRLTNNVPVQGWSALMVVVLISAGIQLLMLGVIGEYLWRIFDAARGRPLFVIDDLLNCRSELKDDVIESIRSEYLTQPQHE